MLQLKMIILYIAGWGGTGRDGMGFFSKDHGLGHRGIGSEGVEIRSGNQRGWEKATGL